MDEVRLVARGEADYPAARLAVLGAAAPAVVHLLGPAALLAGDLTALFISTRCSGSLILAADELVTQARAAGWALLGGWHTPVEQHCLATLLRGRGPLVICPARAIEGLRRPAAWRAPLAAGRLLLVSPFVPTVRGTTAQTAAQRNVFAAALADRLIIGHATPGGRTAALCHATASWGRPVYAIADPANAHLADLGATLLSVPQLLALRG